MDNDMKRQMTENDNVFRNAFERIFQKYSRVDGSGMEVCLQSMTCRTEKGILPWNGKECERQMQSLKKIADSTGKSFRGQDISASIQQDDSQSCSNITSVSEETEMWRSSENVSWESGPDDSHLMSSAVSDFGLQGGLSHLMSSAVSDSGLQGELAQPEELERSLSSQGSLLLDLYPSMLSQVGQACHRQKVTEAANAVLRRYRRRGWRSSASKPHPQSSVPKPDTQSSAPKPHPQSCLPKPHPQNCPPKPNPQGCPPKPHPQGCPPKPHPQSSVPKPHPQSSVPKPHPQSSAPKPHPQSSAPKPHPQSSVPKPHPQNCSPKPHPQGCPPKPHPQSSATKPHPQGSSPKPHPQSSTTKPHPQNSSPKPHPQSSAPKPHPQSSASKPHPQCCLPKPHPQSSAPKPHPQSSASKPHPQCCLPKPHPQNCPPKPNPQGCLPKPHPQGCPPKPHPQGCPPKPHPQGCPPKPHPQGCPPKPHPQNCSPKPHPQSSAPKPHPQSSAPKPHPQSSVPKPHPQNCSPKPHPQGCPPKPHPQSSATKPHPQGSSPKPHPQSSATKPHPQNCSPKPHPQSSAPKPHPQSSASKLYPHSPPGSVREPRRRVHQEGAVGQGADPNLVTGSGCSSEELGLLSRTFVVLSSPTGPSRPVRGTASSPLCLPVVLPPRISPGSTRHTLQPLFQQRSPHPSNLKWGSPSRPAPLAQRPPPPASSPAQPPVPCSVLAERRRSFTGFQATRHQIDQQFEELYQRFVCQRKVALPLPGPASPLPSSSSSALAALALSPVWMRVRKRDQALEPSACPEPKRFREGCACSPGSTRHMRHSWAACCGSRRPEGAVLPQHWSPGTSRPWGGAFRKGNNPAASREKGVTQTGLPECQGKSPVRASIFLRDRQRGFSPSSSRRRLLYGLPE